MNQFINSRFEVYKKRIFIIVIFIIISVILVALLYFFNTIPHKQYSIAILILKLILVVLIKTMME